jgi:hypothetical protein
MKATRQNGWVLVSVSGEETRGFNKQFPCSNIPNGSTFLIELDARNGDLVNVTMHLEDGECVDSSEYDGAGLLALTTDANNFAVNAGFLPQWGRR